MKVLQTITGQILEVDSAQPFEGDDKWIINPTEKQIKEIQDAQTTA
jgi:hypothetical protein